MYVAVYADGTSHSRVCPDFDIVQPCCRSRANRGCLKEEVDCASMSACFGKDCDSRRALNVLRSVPLYLQRQLCCLPVAERFSVCILGARGDSLRTTYEQLPYHQSHLFTFL